MGITLEDLAPDQRPDLCVEVHFTKNSPHPERVFAAASRYIEAMQGLDDLLIKSIETKIKPVLLLDEVESGSIKVWMKQFLNAIDDDALKNIDWKPAVGAYLVKGKHRLLDYLGKENGIKSREDLDQLSVDIHRIAQQTDVRKLPTYRPVSPSDLAERLRVVSDAVSMLGEGETIRMVSDEGESSLDAELSITPEDIREVLAGETLTNESERFLIVRRPDFLGDSMWEFRHEKKSFTARIEDGEWLADFRAGNQVIQPGDALRVTVLETTTYGKDGEVLAEHKTVVKVHAIIKETRYTLPLDE